MKTVNALVLTGFGLNCDEETAHVFKLAGAVPHRVHINALVSGSVRLADFQILAFGGGFSWGDDHGAGVIQALKLKNHVGADLIDFVNQGKLIIGICNGFQALVNLGLLPGFDRDYTRRCVAITYNDCGNFRNQWVRLAADVKSPCVFTRGIETADFPVRHGEGKIIADPVIIDRLLSQSQVVFRYALASGLPAEGAFPDNPNGSLADIAGICDPTGRVFGLMPHPEACHHVTHHPDWPRTADRLKRLGKALKDEIPPGVRLFQNAVDHIRENIL